MTTMTTPRLRLLSCSLLFFGIVLAGSVRASSGWETIFEEDGITVTERKLPGQSFPTFRGVGSVNASIYQVLAVVSDIKRYTQWLGNCLAAKMIEMKGWNEYVIYSRTNAPWPVSDRDAVYRSRVTVNADRTRVTIVFKAIRGKVPEVSGVVRMINLRGHFKFRALGEHKTRIEYQVDADPRGWIPKWVARLASKKIPLSTIQGMRKRVKVTKGWYAKRIKRWKTGKF